MDIRSKFENHAEEVFNVYGAIDNLNRRMKSVEGKVPDYSADMLEVYRNIGALAKRISELEIHVKRLEQKGEKR